jgi:imidazolonepropionase-like amidohydrolase
VGEAGNFLLQNARIFPVASAPIENGFVEIRNGKIARLGSGAAQTGADAKVIDLKGASVYPGMIDAATNTGLIEIPLGAPGTNDEAEIGDMNPNARAIVAVNPHSAHVNVTRNNGVTATLTMPQGGIISGQAAVINLIGSTPDEMAITPAFGLVVNFPRVSTFAGFGGGSRRAEIDFSEAVKIRDKRLEDLRKILKDAQSYAKAQDAYAADNKLPRPTVNLKLASLVPYVLGVKPIMFAVDREVDIRNAIKFADEMKMKAIILGGNDAAKAGELLKQKNIPVILTGVWSLPVRDDDYYDTLFATAGKLQQAGVKFCVATGDNGANSRDLPYQAGMTAAYGLSKDDALKAVTLYPAQILGVADKLGSIEAGKIANLVVTDGDILEPTTHVLHLFINGRKLPLTSRHTELYEQFKNRKLN